MALDFPAVRLCWSVSYGIILPAWQDDNVDCRDGDGVGIFYGDWDKIMGTWWDGENPEKHGRDGKNSWDGGREW